PHTPIPASYTVSINGKKYAVQMNENSAVINGKSYEVNVAEGLDAANGAIPHESIDTTAIKAPMNAKVVKLLVSEGDPIQAGQVVCILEAMKMEIEVRSPVTGIISLVAITAGQQVKTGQLIASTN
ncbi:MAG: acetyl-CoA carboxylase biotin carboxyl carrier protein subunit, partial [bacterium]